MESPRTIPIAPLTREAFAPFGEVVDAAFHTPITINEGFAERVNALAKIDTTQAGGVVNVSIFTARARPQPILIRMMERHPLASQLFFPLQDREWFVVVCADPADAASYRAFRATGRQGVNYARNVWHHPLLVLSDDERFLERFLVIDRGDGASPPANNLEEAWLAQAHWLQLAVEG